MSPTASWIPVTERLPKHEQRVLVWTEADRIELATFYARHIRWVGDPATEREKVISRSLARGAKWGKTRDEVIEDIDASMPFEPYFSGGGGDCNTKWVQSLGFAAIGERGDYGWQPAVTHWMPMPEGPSKGLSEPMAPTTIDFLEAHDR